MVTPLEKMEPLKTYNMKKKQIKVLFNSGYAGGAKVEVCLDYKGEMLTYAEVEKQKANGTYHENKWYRIEEEELEQLITKEIAHNGYAVEQTKRQKYPRIKFNL